MTHQLKKDEILANKLNHNIKQSSSTAKISIKLNNNIRGLKKSPTLEINERCQVLEEKGMKIFRLGFGQSPFPVPDVVVETLRQNAMRKEYLPSQGHKDLRNAIAKFHKDEEGLYVSPDNILIGPGSKELLFILQLVFDGELLVPNPCWVSYSPQAEIFGKKVQLLNTNFKERWRIQPETLQTICESDKGPKSRLMILNYPGNPDGLTYNERELRNLAEIARENEIIILSDEIYGQLHHKGNHISIANFYPEGTIVSAGISKWCGAGGWRLGTFAFPNELKDLLEIMVSVASETFSSVSTPIQYAAIRAFKRGQEIDEYVQHSRRILSTLGNHCADTLQNAGINVHSPEGGFYLFPDMSSISDQLQNQGITTSKELCQQLLNETGVAVLPGQDFGRPENELTSRLSYVNFDGQKALDASKAISLKKNLSESFLQENCFNTIEAVRLMSEWFQDKTK